MSIGYGYFDIKRRGSNHAYGDLKLETM